MENFNLTRGSIYHLIRQISLAIGGKRLVGCTYRGSSLIDNSLSSFPRVFFFGFCYALSFASQKLLVLHGPLPFTGSGWGFVNVMACCTIV